MPNHSPSWRCAAVGGCAGLPVPFSSSSSLPFFLSWRPSSSLSVGWSKRGLQSHCWYHVSLPHSCAHLGASQGPSLFPRCTHAHSPCTVLHRQHFFFLSSGGCFTCTRALLRMLLDRLHSHWLACPFEWK